TLIHVDLAAVLDCAERADGLADVTAAATFRTAVQPIEHADAAQDSKTSPKRAGEAAVKTLDEQARRDNSKRVGDHRPFGHEAKNDGGFERLDFAPGHGQVPGEERYDDEPEEEQIFHREQ